MASVAASISRSLRRSLLPLLPPRPPPTTRAMSRRRARGTAFSMTERDRLGLHGLLLPNVVSSQQQLKSHRATRFLLVYAVGQGMIQLQEEMVDMKWLQKYARDGQSDTYPLAKWRIRNRLHDRNETMYYKVLIDNIEEHASIVYTPTVRLVCQNYSGLFRRPRGMYFSAEDRGEMMSMVYNWPADQVLPVMIDIGTNNEKLLKDPLYLGLQENRLEGEEYVAVTDEFMEAVFARWPNVVQFEDFQSKWAFRLLQRYRKAYCMFNDDVQHEIKKT
ncbi:hypothetical protein ABZP36_019377 [Zizania latifolia]